MRDSGGQMDPFEFLPELSRRERGVPVGQRSSTSPVWGDFDRRRHRRPRLRRSDQRRGLHAGLANVRLGRAHEGDHAKADPDGTVWMLGSHWQAHDILRIAVGNYSTGPEGVAVAIVPVARAMDE